MSILVVDFGCQYTNLIANRVRDLGVYCEIVDGEHYHDWNVLPRDVKGIVLSGGPHSVTEENHPRLPDQFWEFCDKPILGICYGMQLMAEAAAGVVVKMGAEFGSAKLNIVRRCPLFVNVPEDATVWNSHSDSVIVKPNSFDVLARNEENIPTAIGHWFLPRYAVQFHPEVDDSSCGKEIFENFIFGICKCEADWKTEDKIENIYLNIQNQVQDHEKVLMAISGGVDSSVAALLLHKVIGERLTCVFIDHGFHRENEPEELVDLFKDLGLEVHHLMRREKFLEMLRGIEHPETKRKLIGAQYINEFSELGKGTQYRRHKFLGQGTILSDVIESKGIKSHHNVGGLPEWLDFELIEPIRHLFKNEVREIGKALGLPTDIIWRQPVPGVGLAIRVIGEVTKEKLRIVRKADYILRQELEASGEDKKLSQWFAAMLPVKTVGVKGDKRSYEYPIVLRMVKTEDFMTAKVPEIDYLTLRKITDRIVNEVPGINRVLVDLTNKPSGCVEYE